MRGVPCHIMRRVLVSEFSHRGTRESARGYGVPTVRVCVFAYNTLELEAREPLLRISLTNIDARERRSIATTTPYDNIVRAHLL